MSAIKLSAPESCLGATHPFFPFADSDFGNPPTRTSGTGIAPDGSAAMETTKLAR